MTNGSAPRRGIVWFRRDLRVADNQVLRAALDECDEIVPLFVVQPSLWSACANRRWFLAGCLHELDAALHGALVVRHGSPLREIVAIMREHAVSAVYHAQDVSPFAARRDTAVARGVEQAGGHVVVTDQPWTFPAGTLRTGAGEPFKVYTPYLRRWLAAPREAPIGAPRTVPVVRGVRSDGLGDVPPPPAALWRPHPGERAAHAALDAFIGGKVDAYASSRNDPGADATSRLGPYLKFGCLHPRQILHRLDLSRHGHRTFAHELAWRDFYADVLRARPGSAWVPWNEALAAIRTDAGAAADERFAAWCAGRTGYPIVDAGMRQLLAEGFVHNRVRMIVASFLVKDLHIDWARGARHFLTHLYDGDLAANNHGWQWVAGTGTDAAPYFRVFNPVAQSKRFDPDGRYVRRWVGELAGVAAPAVHAPWTLPGGPPAGYPAPIVDHAIERAEALRRYAELRR
jgi:deoxyribodipyrimidine photo-lyase